MAIPCRLKVSHVTAAGLSNPALIERIEQLRNRRPPVPPYQPEWRQARETHT